MFVFALGVCVFFRFFGPLLAFIIHCTFYASFTFQLINNHHANKFFSLSDRRLFAEVFAAVVCVGVPIKPAHQFVH